MRFLMYLFLFVIACLPLIGFLSLCASALSDPMLSSPLPEPPVMVSGR